MLLASDRTTLYWVGHRSPANRTCGIRDASLTRKRDDCCEFVEPETAERIKDPSGPPEFRQNAARILNWSTLKKGIHPVRIARKHYPRVVPRVGLPRNCLLIGSLTAALRCSKGWVRKDANLGLRTGGDHNSAFLQSDRRSYVLARAGAGVNVYIYIYIYIYI